MVSAPAEGVIPVIVGASGVVAGITRLAIDCKLVPLPLTARILTLVAMPLVSPVIVNTLLVTLALL
jgi:hypothetical protein